MRTARPRKLLSGAIALIVLGCLWLCFAPPLLGGSTSYVVTDGISMQPRFHSGDLALVRSQSSYRVGQIVAYHSILLHTVVLHRIIARAGDRYVFKGDNNNFVDFEHPAASQLIGALWIHIPGAGAELNSLRSPGLIGGLVAFGALVLMGAAFVHRRRRRGRARRAAAPPPRRAAPTGRDPGRLLGIVAVGLLALAPFFVLALLAFTRPSVSRQPVKLPYKQEGKLTYAADTAPGPTYPAGRAGTGDPLFTRVLSAIDFGYDYRFHAAAPHSLAGRATLAAAISSTSGWKTTLPLGAASYFRGDRVVVNGTLDVASLNAMVHRVETTTGVSGVYTLTLIAHIAVGGSLGSVPVRAGFSPSVPFSFSREEIRPVVAPGVSAAATGGQPSAGAFEMSRAGASAGRRYQPTIMSLGITRISVGTARAIAIAAILMIALAIGLALYLVRPRRRSETESIRARYGSLIVPVARVWQQPGVSVIDVEDFDSLVRIAEHYERSILFELTEYGEAFWVTDESGQFRYVVDPGEQASFEHATSDPLSQPEHDRVDEVADTPPEPVHAPGDPDGAYEPAGAPGEPDAAYPPTVQLPGAAHAPAADPDYGPEPAHERAGQLAGPKYEPVPDLPYASEGQLDPGEIYASALEADPQPGAQAEPVTAVHALAAPEPPASPESVSEPGAPADPGPAAEPAVAGWPRAQTYAGRRAWA